MTFSGGYAASDAWGYCEAAMKQVLQNLRSGETTVEEVPAPGVQANSLLIRTRASLISAGTERSMVEFGKASLIGKARGQPDRVKQVLAKIKADGLLPTMEAVFAKLDEPMPLGYCNVGEVLEVGPGVSDFKPGDRVASNGHHAEIVCVPGSLCAKIPDEVTDEQAAFMVVSSIGLQGIRLLNPTLGERIVVYGLGLIGLLSVQLLRMNGCEVLGVDVKADRLKRAESCGAKVTSAASGDPVAAAEAWTEGKGVDGVLITAAAKTNEIVHNAALMSRKRGRIVLVGVVGLDLIREDFYKKELSFQVSASYGPGRYDENYEQRGQDYPRGFVRWTEGRNFQAVLAALRTGELRVDDLITHRFPLADASAAYETLSAEPSVLGVLLEYSPEADTARKLTVTQLPAPASGQAVVGVIGAGLYARGNLIPYVAKAGARIAYVADLKGEAAQHAAAKNRAEQALTDYKTILADPTVQAVLIATGHSVHARLVCEALSAGKHAFVEKPLAMNEEELSMVLDAAAKAPDRIVMVGFNRRFSPHVVKMKELLAGRSGPLCMNMTINAGHIPAEHWVHDPVKGGGRIIGEACHFIDLMAHLAESPVTRVAAAMVAGRVAVEDDKMSILLSFDDGSVGTVNYFANGSKSYPKEMLEVFSDGRVLKLDNFRRLRGYGFKGFRKFKTARQDKGHAAEFAAFVARVAEGGQPLIPLEELANVTLASFAAVTAAADGRTIVPADEYAEILATAGEKA